jgi:hypothetical protein
MSGSGGGGSGGGGSGGGGPTSARRFPNNIATEEVLYLHANQVLKTDQLLCCELLKISFD